MCLPLPWGGSTNALIPCHTSPDSLQCCPLEATHPIRPPAIISPAPPALLHHKLPDSLMTGTISCATSDHPLLQCSHWPLCQRWKPLVTGTRASADGLLSSRKLFYLPFCTRSYRTNDKVFFNDKARLMFSVFIIFSVTQNTFFSQLLLYLHTQK